jgi:hypothetical protein
MLGYNINIGKCGMGVWKFIERVFQATRALNKMLRALDINFLSNYFYQVIIT